MDYLWLHRHLMYISNSKQKQLKLIMRAGDSSNHNESRSSLSCLCKLMIWGEQKCATHCIKAFFIYSLKGLIGGQLLSKRKYRFCTFFWPRAIHVARLAAKDIMRQRSSSFCVPCLFLYGRQRRLTFSVRHCGDLRGREIRNSFQL